jgi:hypothetical protein
LSEPDRRGVNDWDECQETDPNSGTDMKYPTPLMVPHWIICII